MEYTSLSREGKNRTEDSERVLYLVCLFVCLFFVCLSICVRNGSVSIASLTSFVVVVVAVLFILDFVFT